MRVLLIGPLHPVGGATVLFGQLLEELRHVDGVTVGVIDTGRSARGCIGNLRQALRVIRSIVREVGTSDVVSFHASPRGALLFAPVVGVLCRLAGRPWSFRGFGGSYSEWYRRAGPVQRWVFRWAVLAADAVLLETRDSVAFFQPLTRRPVHWYANSRPRPRSGHHVSQSPGSHSGDVRLLFLGHVCREKGVLDLVAAAGRITNATVDVYGPLTGDLGPSAITGRNVSYRGTVAPAEVTNLLRQYSALVLPTKWVNEGYPGVIIEAYQSGLPVVATNWRAIPEIVDERSGLLVEAGNPIALAAAIQLFVDSPQLQRSLGAGALKRAEEFESMRWTRRFVDICHGVIRGGQVCTEPCSP